MVLIEQKKQKKVNPFFEYVKKIRAENPDIKSQKEIITLAKKTYVPLSGTNKN